MEQIKNDDRSFKGGSKRKLATHSSTDKAISPSKILKSMKSNPPNLSVLTNEERANLLNNSVQSKKLIPSSSNTKGKDSAMPQMPIIHQSIAASSMSSISNLQPTGLTSEKST